MIEFAGLALFSAQQLGVMLAVGAETVLLTAYLLAIHHPDRAPRQQFLPAVRFVQGSGLFLILLSGAGAVWLHYAAQQFDVLLAPAFLFKWALIAMLLPAYLVEHYAKKEHAAVRGFAGASWFALFLVHTLAPVASWADLLALYVAWLLAFGFTWAGFVLVMRRTKIHFEVAAPAPEQPQPPREAPEYTIKLPRFYLPHFRLPALPKFHFVFRLPKKRIEPEVKPEPVIIIEESSIEPTTPPEQAFVPVSAVAEEAVTSEPALKELTAAPEHMAPLPVIVSTAVSAPESVPAIIEIPVPAAVPVPAAAAANVSADSGENSPYVPALHVMPKTPEDIPEFLRKLISIS